jgi:very-short-patch-repair endonuclease
VKSPIEDRLREALINQACVESNNVILADHTLSIVPISAVVVDGRVTGTTDSDFANDMPPRVYGDGTCFLGLYRNVLVDRYRVDFLAWFDYGDAFVAIECDGHDWHDRTKQQASADRARDRALLRLGVTTIRFTGSDIFHDADACAVEAIDIAKIVAKRSWFSGHEHGWIDGHRAALKPRSAFTSVDL